MLLYFHLHVNQSVMNIQAQHLVIVALLFVFTSCEQKIDGSSEESFEHSMDEIKASLKGEEKENFKKAVAFIAFNNIDLKEVFSGESDSEEIQKSITERLDGMTAKEVIAEAERLRSQLEAKKKEEAKEELQSLYEKRDLLSKNKEKLMTAVTISKERFYKYRPTRYSSPKAVIEFTIKNNLEVAISRAYFMGELSSPGRSVPWIKDSFNYEISGGLEPGEEKKWSLEPNILSDWSDVSAPDDAVLSVEAVGLEGVDGEVLYSLDVFSDTDQERLDEILEKYPDLE